MVAEGKESFAVYDSVGGPTVTINNSTHGGNFMNTTKSDVVLEVIEQAEIEVIT